MCCGFLHLSIDEFMDVQNRLMTQQLQLLNDSKLGKKIFKGKRPETIEEFRNITPLTTYKDYCPELLEKQEDSLPGKPLQWVHSSGRSGEYAFKWIPMTEEFCQEMSVVSYGVGMIACSSEWGDSSHIASCPKMVYAVAPRPYMSGAMAAGIERQTPVRYLPPLEYAEGLSFEERIREGFKDALSVGFDYFFGMSMVLVTIGNRFSESSQSSSFLPLLKKPRTALRLVKGFMKSKLAGRALLPRDIWKIKGIMCGGLDSAVYRDKIKKMWGRYPLDIYAGTEGGIYAAQTWDYDTMTFIPNLNFFEFITEDEHMKWQMDRSYQPKTLLLDEVEAGKLYEIVITNFHGGSLVRYRLGDMIRITSLKQDKAGFNLPQMVFERRANDIIDFAVVRLSEKHIWQAIEKTGVQYEDWIAYKAIGAQVLNIFVELKAGEQADEKQLAAAVYRHLTSDIDEGYSEPEVFQDTRDMVGFEVNVTLLSSGTFADYTTKRQAEGADLAHLKPPHVNPTDEVLTLLVKKPGKAEQPAPEENEAISV